MLMINKRTSTFRSTILLTIFCGPLSHAFSPCHLNKWLVVIILPQRPTVIATLSTFPSPLPENLIRLKLNSSKKLVLPPAFHHSHINPSQQNFPHQHPPCHLSLYLRSPKRRRHILRRPRLQIRVVPLTAAAALRRSGHDETGSRGPRRDLSQPEIL